MHDLSAFAEIGLFLTLDVLAFVSFSFLVTVGLMASPLEGAIAKAIHGGMKGVFYDATLTRVTPGTVNPSTPWVEATDTTTTYTAKGIVEEYSVYHLANSLVSANDRRIMILANSLSTTPVANDKITIRTATYTVISVEIDPANAVWVLRCAS